MIARFRGIHYRLSGGSGPAALYLPGVHGDWTPFHRIRPLLSKELQLLEISYPKSTDWSLADLSGLLVALMDELEIDRAHLLAESFGSLLGWEIGLRHPERSRSIIIVGGFAQPPPHGRAGLAGKGLRLLPSALFERGVDSYVYMKAALGQARPSPGENLPPYFAVREKAGMLSTAHRMDIIQRSDFRPAIDGLSVPVRYLAGARDLIVPVKREVSVLARALPSSARFESELVPGAPHMILLSHPERSSEVILRWVREIEADSSGEPRGQRADERAPSQMPADCGSIGSEPGPLQAMLSRALGFAWTAVIRLLSLTLRRGHREIELPTGPAIFVFWHQKYCLLLSLLPESGATVFTSASFRGRVIAEISRRLGLDPIVLPEHGGGRALEILRAGLERTGRAALAVDGPLGPFHAVKHGAVLLSSVSGHPLIPVSASASRVMTLRSRWDRLEIPLPFSQVSGRLGHPVRVPPNLDDEELELWAREISMSLEELDRGRD